MKRPISLVLVDDHRVVIDGIASLLRDDQDIEVKGVFTRAQDALQFVREEQEKGRSLDVVLSDLRLANSLSGLEFTVQLRTLAPHTKVIIFSMSEEAEDISAAIKIGVAGYVSKNEDISGIRKAILEVMRDGRPYLSNDILHSLANSVVPGTQPDELRQLTPREVEILKLIASEYSTAEIAERLFISEATVETHRRNLIQKLKVKSVVGLTNFALRQGLV